MPDITKVAYGMTIGDLKFGNQRPGVVEATLRPGETLEEALNELDDRITAWHKKRYPHLYQEGGQPVSVKVEPANNGWTPAANPQVIDYKNVGQL